MKVLSRILIAVVVLLGSTFLVMQSRGAAAKKCQNTLELRLGLDENGCESKQPLVLTDSQIGALLRKAGIGEECYRLHTYKDHNPGPYRGSLDMVDCVSKKGAKPSKSKMFQPLGSSQTQRIMFSTSAAKDAFERQIQGAWPKPKKK